MEELRAFALNPDSQFYLAGADITRLDDLAQKAAIPEPEHNEAGPTNFTRDYIKKGASREDIKRLLGHRPLKLMIVGERSTGKSTLWNALLNRRPSETNLAHLLPTNAKGCTSRITVLKWAAEPCINLVYTSRAVTSAQATAVAALERDLTAELVRSWNELAESSALEEGGDVVDVADHDGSTGKSLVPEMLVARGKARTEAEQ